MGLSAEVLSGAGAHCCFQKTPIIGKAEVHYSLPHKVLILSVVLDQAM